jgi:hypothetical protein
MKLAKSFLRDERGTTAVIACVSIAAMMAAGAAAVWFSIQYNAKNELQQAIDSAVLAGTSLPGKTTADQRVAAARRFFDGNSQQILGEAGKPNVTLRITGDPVFAMQTVDLTGDVAGEVYSPLGGFLGQPWMPVTVHARARKLLSEPVCVLGLDPTQSATIDFNGQSELEAVNCAVQSNSESGSGIRQVGKPMLRAKATGVTGKATGTGYEPPPIEGTQPIADPFADLDFPSSGPCAPGVKGEKIQNETKTLDPGTYCGGLWIGAGSNVTLKPGIYVFKNGQLQIISGAVVRGDDVMLAFTGEDATIYMDGSSELHLTSPSGGPYTNMQFFSDPDAGDEAPWGPSFVGNITISFDGAMYFPGQNI